MTKSTDSNMKQLESVDVEHEPVQVLDAALVVLAQADTKSLITEWDSEQSALEYQKYLSNLDKYDGKLITASKAYFNDHLNGKMVNTKIGPVRINSKSRGKIHDRMRDIKYLAIPCIPEVLLTGDVSDLIPLNKDRDDSAVGYYHFSKAKKLNEYTLNITLKVALDNDGNLLYFLGASKEKANLRTVSHAQGTTGSKVGFDSIESQDDDGINLKVQILDKDGNDLTEEAEKLLLAEVDEKEYVPSDQVPGHNRLPTQHGGRTRLLNVLYKTLSVKDGVDVDTNLSMFDGADNSDQIITVPKIDSSNTWMNGQIIPWSENPEVDFAHSIKLPSSAQLGDKVCFHVWENENTESRVRIDAFIADIKFKTSKVWYGLAMRIAETRFATLIYLPSGTFDVLTSREAIDGYDALLTMEDICRHNYLRSDIDQLAHEAATSPYNDLPEPTEEQKSSGDYPKGKIQLLGFDIHIENPAGSTRTGKDDQGNTWSNKMVHQYGYFVGTTGADEDEVDVFVKSGCTSDFAGPIFVIDQVNADGTFDEHKVVLGAANEQEARDIYLSNYEKDWAGLGGITEFSNDDFKSWLFSNKAQVSILFDSMGIDLLNQIDVEADPLGALDICLQNLTIKVAQELRGQIDAIEDDIEAVYA